MAEVTIRATRDGPSAGSGGARVTDHEAVPDETRETVALRRCVASTTTPFCDGTHFRIGRRGRPVGGARLRRVTPGGGVCDPGAGWV